MDHQTTTVEPCEVTVVILEFRIYIISKDSVERRQAVIGGFTLCLFYAHRRVFVHRALPVFKITFQISVVCIGNTPFTLQVVYLAVVGIGLMSVCELVTQCRTIQCLKFPLLDLEPSACAEEFFMW